MTHAGETSVTPTRAEADRMMEMFAGEPLSRAHLDCGWEELAFERCPRAADGARAHLTLTVPGFPNFIITYGPNTGILSGSFHAWIEIYTRYICRLTTETIERGAESFEVKHSTFEAYTRAFRDQPPRK